MGFGQCTGFLGGGVSLRVTGGGDILGTGGAVRHRCEETTQLGGACVCWASGKCVDRCCML